MRARTWTLFYLTYLVVLMLPCVGTQERTFLEYTARKSAFSCICIFRSLSCGRDMCLYTPIGYIMVFCSYPEIFYLYFQEYEDLSILVLKCYRGRYLKMTNIPLRGYLRKSCFLRINSGLRKACFLTYNFKNRWLWRFFFNYTSKHV